jgi:ribonucleoside-diphosphate reductase alpha chain
LVNKEVTVLTQTESGDLAWRHMSNIRLTRHGATVYQVEVESTITGTLGGFRATGDHKMWLAEGSTITVAELRPGDHLSSAYRLTDGQLVNSQTEAMAELSPVNHSVVSVTESGIEDVYCGTVEETHRFFIVTEKHGGVLVANCGEQWLGPYDACNLGSINLGIFVENGEIDWTELERVTRVTTRFLDDVIEINPFPLPEVHAKVHANRRIGLGVMGWAEMLFELGLPYDSDEAIFLGERVMAQIKDWATDESRKMAEERGEFPNFSHSIYKDGPKLRNSTRTTVAPTGSISILADCSSGIEPIFALAFQHRVKQPDSSYRVLDFVNPFFKRALEESAIEDKESVLEYVKQHGSLHGHPASENPALKPYITAHEIAPDWHIRMQASFQKGVDNSISKTINAPNSATYDDVRHAYMLAWNLGCLGITIFRDGSKGEQVLNVGVKEPSQTTAAPAATATVSVVGSTDQPSVSPVQQEEATVETVSPATAAPVAPAVAPVATASQSAPRSSKYPNGIKPRPVVMSGYTRQVRAPEGTVNITMNSDVEGLFEVFVNVGKAGSDVSALAEALGRLISRFLQIDSPLTQDQRVAEVARQLSGIGGSSSIGFGPNRVRSLPDAVARAMDLYLGERGNGASAAGIAALDEEGGDEETDGDDGESTAHRPQASGAGSNAGASAAHGTASGGQVNGHGFNPATHALFTITGNLCPQCGNNTLYMEEGCKKCVSCGHSEC